MAFTDRFIKLPVDLYNVERAKVIGYNSDSNEGETYIKVNPLDISFYGPGIDDNDDLKHTLIHFKSGDAIHIKISTKQFEDMLNEKMK